VKFSDPISEGKLVKRYKRFFADIETDDGIITALTPNTGSMKGLLDAGNKVRFSSNDDPKRKLKYTLEQIKVKTSWVGVNTGLPNKFAMELWNSKSYKPWTKYPFARAEVKINDKSRLDMALWKDTDLGEIKKFQPALLEDHKFHFIEIKNTTLGEDGVAMFPDSVTSRGLKHLHEMIQLVEAGHTAEMLYVVQRTDCETFQPASDIDPEYAKGLKEAKKAGVKVTAMACDLKKGEIRLNPEKLLKVHLSY
tara:strand:- start:57 stop:809 length:753 start_codon:yes stop_codon:yes gene_type:complete